MKLELCSYTPDCWEQVRDILDQCLRQNSATFFHQVPNQLTWERDHLQVCRLVAREEGGRVLGWAALQPMDLPDEGEVSIYVDPDAQGLGIGSRLLRQLVLEAEEAGLARLIARIYENNAASQRLHAGAGFSMVSLESGGKKKPRVLVYARRLG